MMEAIDAVSCKVGFAMELLWYVVNRCYRAIYYRYWLMQAVEAGELLFTRRGSQLLDEMELEAAT